MNSVYLFYYYLKRNKTSKKPLVNHQLPSRIMSLGKLNLIHACGEEFRTNLTFMLVNMPRLTIQQRVWVCLQYATVNNAEEVRRRWPVY
jgi:hypothetical protein